MPRISSLSIRLILALLLMVLAGGKPAWAQQAAGQQHIRAELVALTAAQPGKPLQLAIHFTPEPGWHGYWKNPGDAGFGMELDWQMPAGWQAGAPEYPVPQTLLIAGLMNHVYKGDYAVLIPVGIPPEQSSRGVINLAVDADWLACSDTLCVRERGLLELTLPMGAAPRPDARTAAWMGAIPPLLDKQANFELGAGKLRLAIPLPRSFEIADPHLFIANTELVKYSSAQAFARDGDMLVAEVHLADDAVAPEEIEAILAFDKTQGVHLAAVAGDVPAMSGEYLKKGDAGPALPWLLLAALAGGLLLNVMPCVFPILSLKAISLARAGESEAQARREGLAYTAGVVLACVALGGVILALRAGGEQVGWAFQLQQPAVVIALLFLAVAITMNLAGLYQLPGISITRSGEPASAFATGLLAAFVATPCTGPFMAAALGAALLLPTASALLLFAALGLGLALPFLAIGFIPALRKRLPRPGPWMERFRRIMAIPMGLTALALIWLVARLGGKPFALLVMLALFGLVFGLLIVGKLQQRGKLAWPAFGLIAAPFAIFAAFALPASYEQRRNEADSILDPIPYSAQSLAEARASGKPVFVWLTADWCITCKVNESVAIEREQTREAFEKSGVIVLRGDWTQPDPAISAYLDQFGAAGVPLYVWYAPGGEGEVMPQVLTPGLLADLAAGRAVNSNDNPRPTDPATGSD